MPGTVDLLTIGEAMGLLATPAHSSLTAGDSATVSFGGAECNVAVAASALGVASSWLSAVGDDAVGRLVLNGLATRGVDTSRVRIDPAHPTGLMLKEPAPTGSKITYYRTGSAASCLSAADLVRAPRARVVHVSGILPALSSTCLGLIEHVLEPPRAYGVVSFDVNYRPALWTSATEAAETLLALAAKADVVFVGRDEAETLWGTGTAEQVRALLPSVAHLIVKDGDVEAVEFHEGGIGRVESLRVEVVEPVGAGDAFAAGWIAAYLRGHDAEQRLTAGHLSAASVLRSAYDIVPIAAKERS